MLSFHQVCINNKWNKYAKIRIKITLYILIFSNNAIQNAWNLNYTLGLIIKWNSLI